MLSGGTTVAPDEPTFILLGGGPEGSLGGTLSWLFGVVICVAAVLLPRQRPAPTAQVRISRSGRSWAEGLLGRGRGASCSARVYIANSYHWPAGLATQYAAAHGITEPPGGLQIEAGIPFPLVIVIGVTIVMTFLATRRRFGRDIFAYGGNPDAAELAGINTRWTIMKTFILMGILCAISAAIASARLNGGTLDLGTGYELYVIAAAVIGGTSFAGGIGTIPGAILGRARDAVAPVRPRLPRLQLAAVNMVAAVVLVAVVGIDAWNRRRAR